MKLDNNLCLKVLLDMCKIKYTDKQLVKLENLLSKLYILRTCSVNLGEISQDSGKISESDNEIFHDTEEFSQNTTEDFEIKEELDESFLEPGEVSNNTENIEDESSNTEKNVRAPVVISLTRKSPLKSPRFFISLPTFAFPD